MFRLEERGSLVREGKTRERKSDNPNGRFHRFGQRLWRNHEFEK